MRYEVRRNYLGKLELLPEVFEPQVYGIAFPSGSMLREPLNQALLAVLASPRWMDIKGLAEAPPSETWYPTDTWWWWRASRVIHDRTLLGQDQEVIDEFPAFSFLLGDMHPHVLAYPFVFLVVGLAFNLLLSGKVGADAKPSTVTMAGEWTLIYLCLGAIGFLNTWDLPFGSSGLFFQRPECYRKPRDPQVHSKSLPLAILDRW